MVAVCVCEAVCNVRYRASVSVYPQVGLYQWKCPASRSLSHLTHYLPIFCRVILLFFISYWLPALSSYSKSFSLFDLILFSSLFTNKCNQRHLNKTIQVRRAATCVFSSRIQICLEKIFFKINFQTFPCKSWLNEFIFQTSEFKLCLILWFFFCWKIIIFTYYSFCSFLEIFLHRWQNLRKLPDKICRL